ncbi:MAG: dihydrolipoamide acetyltransferase family protein [Clostridiales Family XIII bacterium]|nr:2-oxo acid dehydrogenase subunit E2 [Clostridia bacterium]MDY3013562.1 dihydrolipoamide acetyltransferase family protein [Clostridiales Family XIII bacterium]
MANFINMPRLGLTMTEGVIAKWAKKEGDSIVKGEIIAEIESDKSVVPYESPETGVILKLLANEMDTLACNDPIAIIGEAGESIEDMAPKASSPAREAAEKNEETKAPVRQAGEKVARKAGEKVFASPSAKRVARENGVDLKDVPMTKGKARITKEDVLDYLQESHVKATPLAKKIAAEEGIDLKDAAAKAGARVYSADVLAMKPESAAAEVMEAASEDTILPVTGMRKVIAARMKESLEIAAHLTTVIDVDMTSIIQMRTSIMDKVQDRYGVKLSFNDIIMKCVASSIEQYPRVNCQFTEKQILVKKKINLGMAVAVGEGLVVPVINNANELSLGQIAAESKRLASKAKETGLAPDDMSGGTFTVSNLGMYGISSFTSIINQPESAILSVGGTQKKPIVTSDDEIVIRPMATLTLSYDHRAMDGSMSAIFPKTLKEIMEEPYRMMI